MDSKALNEVVKYTYTNKVFQLVIQGCHGTGKTGNLKVNFSRQGKHREFAKKY